jgi:hypothetical protein
MRRKLIDYKNLTKIQLIQRGRVRGQLRLRPAADYCAQSTATKRQGTAANAHVRLRSPEINIIPLERKKKEI